ncbi:MAG: MFS transporter [Arcobacteraceae bacterium]|nr:MFS transporter [Arcobacteraceae bacterium]
MHKSHLTKQTILLLASLYTTQFVGFAFFSVAVIAIWRKAGMPLEQLGLLSMLSLVWVVKFLWAPWVDRYVLQNHGNYKKFITIVQTLLVVAIVGVSFLDVIENKTMIIVSLIAVGLLSATQDIAVEGLTYKILTKKERGFGGTLKTIGGILGYIIGAGVALSIYEKIGWGATILMLASLTAITLIQIFFYKEHTSKVEIHSESISWKIFYRFWNTKDKKLWLIFLILFPTGMSIANGLLVPLLVDIGWSLEKIGYIKGVVGSVLGILSAILSGWLLKHYDRINVLIGICLFEAIAFLSLLFIYYGNDNIVLNALAISSIFISYGASMPIISALIMDHIEKSPNTEYALQFAIYMLMGVIAGGSGVSLSGVFGYDIMIVVSSLFSFISMIYVLLFFKGIEYERD